MSQQRQQKDMTGVLFKNDRKTADNQPDYRGDIVVRGERLQLSAWIKTASNGKKFMSLAVSEPFSNAGQRQESAPPPKPAPAKQASFNDDDAGPF